MTIPTVPPLAPGQRTRLRSRIIAEATSEPPRRWAPTIIATASVGAVVGGMTAGTVLVDPASEEDPAAAPQSVVEESVISIDKGPATAIEIRQAIHACDKTPHTRPAVLWSRRVRSLDPGAKHRHAVVAIIKEPDGRRYGCMSNGRAELVIAWNQVPSTLAWTGFESGNRTQFETFRRVPSQVVRVETRYTWESGASPWYRGVVVGGIAYSAESASMPEPAPSEKARRIGNEIRGFDAQGNPVRLEP